MDEARVHDPLRTEEPSSPFTAASLSGLSPVRVHIGLDAVVVDKHHVCVREALAGGRVRLSQFNTPPTLAAWTCSATG